MTNRRPHITGRTTLSRGWHLLEQFTVEYRDRLGRSQSMQREVCRRGDRAVALLQDRRRDMVLLVRQFRLAACAAGHEDGCLLECPSGLVDGGEPRTAILREVLEETGCQILRLDDLFTAYMSPGTLGERMHFFTGEYQGGHANGVRPTAGEDVEPVEIPLRDAAAMIEAGLIVDAKTILLLYHAQIAARPEGHNTEGNGAIQRQPDSPTAVHTRGGGTWRPHVR